MTETKLGTIEAYNTSYAYHTAGNLMGIKDALGNTFNFSYDTLGRKIALDDPDLGRWEYKYDLTGNLIAQSGGGGNLITGDDYYREYDGQGQLLRVRNGNNASAALLEEYFYDPFGQRIKIKRNDTAQTIVYTPFKEFMRIINTSGTYDFKYIYQDDVLVARVNPDSSKYYYQPDHLGSTTIITDSSGNAVENTSYAPFGEVVSGGSKEVKLYTGQFSDDLTDQYYYGARYYKPSVGLFVQPDTLLPRVYDPQQLNHYSYVMNNPYHYVDPTGHDGGTTAALIILGLELFNELIPFIFAVSESKKINEESRQKGLNEHYESTTSQDVIDAIESRQKELKDKDKFEEENIDTKKRSKDQGTIIPSNVEVPSIDPGIFNKGDRSTSRGSKPPVPLVNRIDKWVVDKKPLDRKFTEIRKGVYRTEYKDTQGRKVTRVVYTSD